MNQQSYFEELANGIRLIIMPAKKFKTISLGLFMHQELRPELAAATALLPSVLERGSSRYPDTITLRRALEQLYGAELSADIHKKGELHLISFTLETVHDRYVNDNRVLEKGLNLLSDVVVRPLFEGDGFRRDYVLQEKEQLGREIKGLINDKALYSLEKCFSLMCSRERFGVFKLGRLEDLEQINPVSLCRYYNSLKERNPMVLYVVGDLEKARVLDAAAAAFDFPRRPLPGLPPTVVQVPVKETRFFEEEMAVNQAKLVMGFRTGTGFRDDQFHALQVYNGILGAFPHSKLFVNVREKNSLAYYVFSRLERHKGIMVVAAGIEAANYEKTRGIIEEQLATIAAGRISDDELENTRRGLARQLRIISDSPYQLINYHLDGSIGGRTESIEEMIAGINAVTVEEVQVVANRIKLDTVYLLRGPKGGGGQ